MTAKLKKLTKNSEFLLFALFLVTWIIFGLINNSIFTVANIYSLIRASISPAIFSLALMLVMLQGGIDMSVATIGCFGSYCAILIVTKQGMMDVSMLTVTLLAIVISVALEVINWFLIDRLSLQPFITTLGTSTLLQGAILAFISTSYIYTLPTSLHTFGTTYLAQAFYPDGGGTVLPLGVVVVIVLYIVVHLLLNHSRFGRNLYAIGADVEAARRAGIKVSLTRLLMFVLVGAICAIGGVVHDCIARSTMPNAADLVGQELTLIAAIVLGCGGFTKSKGSVLGTLLGVLYLRFVMTNLILLGVSSFWQKFVVGIIILVALLAQMSSSRRQALQ